MDSRFKLIFLIAVLFMTSLPVMGILRGTNPPPDPSLEDDRVVRDVVPASAPSGTSSSAPIPEEMVHVPAGTFVLGTNSGGYNERPQIVVYVKEFWIDKYEVTNHHYMQFVEATGHRTPGPPSRYARKLAHLRGPNQPVTYVSWEDADAYCRWKGKRLPTELEWEKAMRGPDGRLWPWGNALYPGAANLGGKEDGYEYTAPVGTFVTDQSVYGVFDGAGNLMEWVDDWYVEDLYRIIQAGTKDKPIVQKTYKTLRGQGYTSRGADLRITQRSFMVPDFRDETIGFRCATSRRPESQDVIAEALTTSGARKSEPSYNTPK
ncbi:MAG: formylglycine-generating enzyme family protein [Nitrospirae bacterium]|nr:MAG: formylglycine-generating enzyme family protein [Nitrospirota bacterium]